MKSRRIRTVIYTLLALTLGGCVLMLIPRAYGALYPEKKPLGYHYLWTSYLAIAVGLEDLIDTNPPVPEDVEAIRNVEYKNIDGQSLQLDIYKPKGLETEAPLLIFIHGGSWVKGHRKDMLPLLLDFADRGYVTATVSYRLGSYPECVEDVSDAVNWFYDHGTEYSYDPDRIALIGASAGAHLAMMAGYGWENKKLNRDGAEEPHRIKAVVNIFGPVDLTTAYARSRPTIISLLGKPYEEAPDLYLEASPLRYVDKNVPPTMTIHGTSDELVPNSQADQLNQRLDSAGIPHVDHRYPLWPHAMILVQRVYDHCTPEMNEFLDKYLNKPYDDSTTKK